MKKMIGAEFVTHTNLAINKVNNQHVAQSLGAQWQP
jgi:hypothetical protein